MQLRRTCLHPDQRDRLRPLPGRRRPLGRGAPDDRQPTRHADAGQQRSRGFKQPHGRLRHAGRSTARSRLQSAGPADVLIATYPKAGTTLMQQIVHGLRTGGDMDFDEITEVVPWLEVAHDVGLDLDAPQRAEPQGFQDPPEPGPGPEGAGATSSSSATRSIHSFPSSTSSAAGCSSPGPSRSATSPSTSCSTAPAAAATGSTSCPGGRSASTRTRSGSASRTSSPTSPPPPPASPPSSVSTRSTPTSRSPPARRRSTSCANTARRFDDHLVRNARSAACGLPASGTTSKVRKGKSGEGAREVPPEVLDVWDREWKRIVAAATGHNSYPELRAAIQP